MLQIAKYLLLITAVFNYFATIAVAAESNEISSITVLSDARLAVPLSKLASTFTRESTISVSSVFGKSELQKKKIEDGDSADVFITSEPILIQQLRMKGLVDVYSAYAMASQGGVHYTASVVAGENMTPARAFLEYLKTPEAHAILQQNGYTVP